MKVSRRYIPAVLYVAYSTQRRHNILTAWPKYAMLFAVHVRAWGIQAGGGRSAVRCCGLFSCLHLVPRLRGGLAPGRRAMSRVSLRSLAGLKRYARLPCRCAAAALSGLRRCGGSAGARPLRRGRGCPAGSPVAPGCSPLRLRGCCASLRPRSPLRSAAPPLRSFPAAPWVAALPSRSLGGAVAVARRAWAAAPPSLRSVARVAAARPARLPAAPCSRLRSRGGAARPLGRSLRSRPAAAWWASRPPAFWPAAARGLPLRRGIFILSAPTGQG